MSQLLPARWLACATALAALSAWGQAETVPATAASSAPVGEAARPRPALDGYQPFTDDKVLPWKEVNDTVGKVGGWRAYAKEASESQASPGVQAPAHHTPEAPRK